MHIDENQSHYLGHRQRLKEKFEKFGLSAFADYEILEFALTFVLPRKDVKPIAKELVKKFGSLKQVVDADANDLIKIKGLSSHSAAFISFLKQFAVIYCALHIKESKSLSSPEAVTDYLKTVLGGEKVEKLYAVFLNSGNKVIECKEIESGTVNKSVVIPRKVAQYALKVNAAAVILAHNHPGGSLKPSAPDIAATSAVKASLQSIDINLLDHIIISNNGYFSFKENALL
ncbi:RadC family protein [Endomicrobium proavitum]|uniref:DNA repair protein RadC n=1 Tax=Endomicrobium proavitum TaxID=1408281 RepID=A0A0G3WIQ3_9BACT|nr:DNA repair protein RadC [Endomicrobium proavitum]AKL97770.1 DNA repair protein RadC [Endomicrobium proavitum]